MTSGTEKSFDRAPATSAAACAAFEGPPGSSARSTSRIRPRGCRAAAGSASGGIGGRRRRGTGRREGAAGRQAAGEREVQVRLIGPRLTAACLIVPRLMGPRLIIRCLSALRLFAQGGLFANRGDALGQPGEQRGKTVEEGGGDHACEHI